MKLPKFAYINVNARINLEDFLNHEDIEFLERNDFKDEALKNKLEQWIRDEIWEYIPENKISIEFD